MVALATAFIKIRPSVDRREFKREGERAGDEAGRAASSRVGVAGKKAGKDFGDNMGKGLNSSTFTKVAAVAASRFGLIGIGAAAATPGVIHFTAALAPAAGALTAVPVAAAGFLAATTAIKIAAGGTGTAISKGLTGSAKEYEKALENLPAPAAAFTKSVVAMKAPILAVRNSISSGFFDQFNGQVNALARIYLPIAQERLGALAANLGLVTAELGRTARESATVKAVSAVLDATTDASGNLLGSVSALGRGLSALLTATAPILPQLAAGFTDGAKAAGAYLVEASRSGRVTDAFASGVAVIKDLIGILLNVGSIVRSVFQAAEVSGGGLLGNLRSLTAQAAAFLNSTTGFTTLTTIFATLSALGESIRTALGGVLPNIGAGLAILGPAISAAAAPAGELIAALAPAIPSLATIAALVITSLTPALAALAGFLSQNEVLVRVLVGAFIAYRIAAAAAAAITAVQAAGGLLAFAKASTIARTATLLATAAQTAFGVALRFALGPIGLIITTIGLVTAAVIYLWKNNETFRTIVMAAWNGIKTAITAVGAWFTGTLVPSLIRAYDQLKAAALFLWQNVITPAWNGIKAVINVVVTAVTGYINLWLTVMRTVGSVINAVYQTVVAPVFAAIGKVIEIWWFAVRIVFQAFKLVLTAAVTATIERAKAVFQAVFAAISAAVAFWWSGVKIIFGLFRTYVLGPVLGALQAAGAFFGRIFAAIGGYISRWYNETVKPKFDQVRAIFAQMANGFSIIYNTKIKPLFELFIGFIKNNVVKGFETGVSAIKAAWDKVKAAARTPVAFVVNKVINPFIGGLNKAAKIVGLKDQIQPIAGFAAGGKITGAGAATDNRQAMVAGLGPVQLMGGEFIVNRRDTARALPLLRWINAGMKGGAADVAKRIGRPPARQPGDGSEGWAFKDGGLIGWVKDVWGAVSDPIGAIKRPFEAALGSIPGGGMIRDFLIGSAKKILGGAASWLGSFGGGGGGTAKGKVGAAQSFVRAQAGKPYVWASAGPGGYDCSGIVSAAYNVLKGNNPHSHTFSTGSMPGPWFDPRRKTGALVAGWSHPGQRPAGSSVGHMAGQIAGMPFESTGSGGVRVGRSARRVTEFANVGGVRLASGGQVPVKLFDSGGWWPSGTLGANMSGRTEYVSPNRPAGGDVGGGVTVVIKDSVISSAQHAEDLVVQGYNAAKRKKRIK